MGSLIFDTNILIDELKGRGAARQEIAADPDRSISVVTWMEVLAGTPPHADEPTRRLLADFKRFEIDEAVAEQAAVIRRAGRLKLPDAIILATAQVHGLTLVTRNTKDFRAADPGIRIPYTI